MKVSLFGNKMNKKVHPAFRVIAALILYLDSNLCIYNDVNSWSFTRTGKLDNMTQADIKAWVNGGGGNVSVTLSPLCEICTDCYE